MNILLLVVGFIIISHQHSFGQGDGEDAKLAAHYYNKGSFDKAELYYKKLYKKYSTDSYFEKYYDCLFFQEKFPEAEKVVEKRIKTNNLDISNHFKLASIYEKTGRESEADKIYQNLIDELSPVQSRVQALGKYFLSIGKYQYALDTYNKGKKSNRGGYQYNLELAELYAITNRNPEMITSYLDLLEYSSGYLKSVQAYLSRHIDFETDEADIAFLRTELLSRTQSNPNKFYYNEMLIWYYLQKKEYTGAIIQAKALDRKENSMGRKTYEIGNICKTNKLYKKAQEAFQAIMDFGEKSSYYSSAAQNYLEVSFLQVTEGGTYDIEEVEIVSHSFETELARLGKSNRTILIIERLARIYAFYLDESQKAQDLLYEALEAPLRPLDKARVKILLGDVLVANNQIWDASILYMQVANNFKDDKIGHEAKFKNAKVFYYDGEFDYAKAQLDVLKASTTKLIANDAMRLSLLLQDNLGIDTTLAPVQMYAQADLLFQQNKFDAAFTKLDSISILFPFHSLSDEIIYQKGLIYSKMQKWPEAIVQFEKIIETYWFDILADDAIFRIAEIYDYKLNDQDLAADYYKKILFDYSSSLHVSKSRERFRTIKAV